MGSILVPVLCYCVASPRAHAANGLLRTPTVGEEVSALDILKAEPLQALHTIPLLALGEASLGVLKVVMFDDVKSVLADPPPGEEVVLAKHQCHYADAGIASAWAGPFFEAMLNSKFSNIFTAGLIRTINTAAASCRGIRELLEASLVFCKERRSLDDIRDCRLQMVVTISYRWHRSMVF